MHDISPDVSLTEYVIGTEVETQTSIDFDDGIETINTSQSTQAAPEHIEIADTMSVLGKCEVCPKDQPSINVLLDHFPLKANSGSEFKPWPDSMNCDDELSANDDMQIDTDDENIINAAIRRYHLLGNS